jgi:hypothetical protein
MIGSLHVEPDGLWPDQINPPAAVVEPSDGDYEVSFNTDDGSVVLEVLILTSLTPGRRAARQALNAYLSSSSDESVPAAILRDVTLGGVADTLFVRRFNNYGEFEIDGVKYMGAKVIVEVLT